MSTVAATIQDQFDVLLDEYDRRLQKHPAYAAMPALFRREAARRTLGFTADWLHSGNDAQLIQFIQSTAQQRATQGLDIKIMQHAVNELESILEPLITDVETAKLIWHTLSKAQDAITQQATERLIAEGNRLRQMVDRSPVGIYHTTPEGRVIDANEAFLKIVGYASLDAINQVGVPALYENPADRQRLIAMLQQGPVTNFETRFRRADGQIVNISISVRLVQEAGVVSYLEGILEDITERKRIEQRLNESEERYRRLSDATVEGIVIHDKGILLDANEVFAKMFGYKLSEVIGMAATEFLTPETREITAQNIRSGYEKPYEVMGLRKDGSTFLVEITGNAIPYEGRTVRVTALRDITERQRSREQIERILQETRVRFEVSQALAGQKTEDEVLASLIQQARIYPQALVTTATFDKTGDDIVAVARYAESFESGLTLNLPMGTRFPFSQFPLFRLLSADRPFVSQDTFADDRMDAASIEITRETGAAGFAVFPLTADNEWLGFMMVFARSIGFFDEGKEHLYQTLVEQGAKALQTARLRDQIQTSLERRGRQVQLSTEVAQEIAAAPKLEELFQRVVTLIKERFGYYHAQIFRYDPAQDAVVLVTGYGEAGQKMLAAGHKLAMGRGVVGTAAAASRSILASDVAQDKNWLPNRNLPDTKGELAAPIKLRDQVLGILDVQSSQTGALTADDQLLLEGLCGQIAIAIEHRRAEDRLAEERNLMRTLMDALPDYIYAKDLAGRFILTNAALARLMGAAAPEDLIGKSDWDFYPRELAEQYFASEQTIFHEGQVLLNHEEPNVDALGHQKWNTTTKVPLRNSQGQIIGLVGATRDITERKQAETKMQETLHELERLYRATAREGWQAYREAAQTTPGYLFDRFSLTPQASWRAPIEQGIQQNTLVLSTGEQAVTVTPLAVRGEVIGAVGVYDDPNRPLSPDELALLQEIAEQGALALESARLFEQTQRDAERESKINRITSRIRNARSVDEVLTVATQELRLATQASRSIAEIAPMSTRTLASNEQPHSGNGHTP